MHPDNNVSLMIGNNTTIQLLIVKTTFYCLCLQLFTERTLMHVVSKLPRREIVKRYLVKIQTLYRAVLHNCLFSSLFTIVINLRLCSDDIVRRNDVMMRHE